MVIGSLSVILIHLPTQIIRTATTDYLVGAALAAGLLLVLTLPRSRNILLGEATPPGD